MSIKEHNSDTEQRILKCAEQEFLSKGFAGARTTSIAEAAGVTHAMFHYYFRTKEKLFERIFQEKMGSLRNLIMDSLMLKDDCAAIEDVIREIIHRHLDFLGENPDMPQFIVGEMLRNPTYSEFISGNIKSFSGALFCNIQKLIDEGVKQGRIKYVKAESLILDIISLNVFAFMARPLVNAVITGCMDNLDQFIELRKKDVYETIMCKLQK